MSCPTCGITKTLNELEAEALEKLNIKFKGDISKIAKDCNIGRSTIYRKLKQYGIKNV